MELGAVIPDMALRHCHAFGVDSIVLAVDPDTGNPTHRVFVVHPGSGIDRLLWPDGHYTIGVHNHRFDLRLTMLRGTMIHHLLTLRPPQALYGPDALPHRALFEHRFTSGVDDAARLEPVQMRALATHRQVVMRQGDVVELAAEDLHTVVVPFGAAWLIEEGPDRIESLFYSRLLMPDLQTDGMYQPMSRDDAIGVLEGARLREYLGEWL